MKIDFLMIGAYGEGGHVVYAKLLDTFERAGLSGAVASFSPQTHQILVSQGKRSFDLGSREKKYSRQEIETLGRHFEQKYGLVSLRQFCWVESQYHLIAPERVFNRAIDTLVRMEELFDQNEIGCCFAPPGGDLGEYSAYFIGRSRGIPYIELGSFPRHFDDRMLLFSGPERRLEDFHPIPYEEIPEDGLSFVDELADRIKTNRAVVSYGNSDFQRLAGGRIGSLWYYSKRRDWNRIELKLRWGFQKYVASTVRNCAASLLYSRFEPNEDYVFFPLHLHIDSQITAINPQFYRQEWIVEYLARSLPQGMKLYVKGHPGCIPLSFSALRAIQRIPNVVLLNPETNPHAVMQRARAIAIINSTVGFEALFYQKPVIVLGHWLLKHLGVSFDVDNLADLAVIVREALNTDRIDEKKVYSVIYSLWRATYEGFYYRDSADYDAIVRSLVLKSSRLKNEASNRQPTQVEEEYTTLGADL